MKSLKSQFGFSLPEVIVGVGIMGITIAGMTAMQANQSKEVRALNETLARAELDRNIITALSDGKVCTFLFTNPTSANVGLAPSTAQFAPTGTYPLTAAFTMISIPIIDNTSAPYVVQVGQKASVSSNTLLVDSATNGIRIDIVSSAGSGRYSANLVVSFDKTKTVRQLMPLTFPISLQTTGTSPVTVTSCQLANGQGTANYIAKWQSMTSLDNSVIYQDPTNGNIGIGTTGPGSLLTVQSSTAGRAVLNLYDSSGGGSASVLPTLMFGVTSSNGFSTTSAAKIWAKSADVNHAALHFGAYNAAAPTEQMTLVNSNVGIGTTSPGTTLQVKPAGIGIGYGISLLSSTNNNVVGILQDNTDEGIFRLYSGGGPEKVSIRAGSNSYFVGGNVGIGTTSPGTKLQVKATSLSDGISLLSKTNNNVVGLLQDNGDDGIFRLYTSGSERVVIRGGGNSYITGGNVGIGTTSPVAKLDVAGTLKLGSGSVVGNSCTIEGLMAYDATNHTPIYCDQNLKWSSMRGVGVKPNQTCGTPPLNGRSPIYGFDASGNIICSNQTKIGAPCFVSKTHYSGLGTNITEGVIAYAYQPDDTGFRPGSNRTCCLVPIGGFAYGGILCAEKYAPL